MAKYAYPAILQLTDEGYYVNFPDLEGCYTDGDTLPEALEKAEDVLALTLCDYEDNGQPIPAPFDIKTFKGEDNETASLVVCDTTAYRKANDNRAVKKTLTIPAWLNTQAEKAGVNFSQTLQNALKTQLGI